MSRFVLPVEFVAVWFGLYGILELACDTWDRYRRQRADRRKHPAFFDWQREVPELRQPRHVRIVRSVPPASGLNRRGAS